VARPPHAPAINGKTLIIEAKAGDTGKLFGSITCGMVADALADQLGVEVDRKKLDLHGHIKTVGDHAIDVRVYQDVAAHIVLKGGGFGGAAVEAAEPVADTVVDAGEPAADEAGEDESVADEPIAEADDPIEADAE
jgi:large subunit ribosomal protein L9